MPVDLQQRLLDLVSRAGLLLGSPRIEDVLPGILNVARDTVSADGYAVWRLDRNRGVWYVASHAGVSERFAASMIASFDGRPVSPADITDPITAEDVFATPLLAQRREAYREEGIASMLAIPLVMDEGTGGTVVFYFRRRRTFSRDEIEIARALGHLSAAALRTADLHMEQLRREQQALFLARAAATLGSSLDYHGTLTAVAQLAVPHIADWCAVDVLNAAGAVEQLALAHVDPDRVALARAFTKKYPPDPNSPSGAQQVMRTGEPYLLPHLTDEMIAQGARSAQHGEDVRALRITSLMVVPLRTRLGVAGAMTFVSAESRRHYTRRSPLCRDTCRARAARAFKNENAREKAPREQDVERYSVDTLSHALR